MLFDTHALCGVCSRMDALCAVNVYTIQEPLRSPGSMQREVVEDGTGVFHQHATQVSPGVLAAFRGLSRPVAPVVCLQAHAVWTQWISGQTPSNNKDHLRTENAPVFELKSRVYNGGLGATLARPRSREALSCREKTQSCLG